MLGKKRLLLFILTLSWVVAVQAQTIMVLGEPSQSYYSKPNSSSAGQAKGRTADYFRDVVEAAGYEVELQVMPWTRAYDTTLKQPDVILLMIAKSPEREGLFHWVDIMVSLKYHLYAYGQQRTFTLRDLHHEPGLRIGAQKGDVLYKYLISQGLNNVIPVIDPSLLFPMIEKGRIDLVTSSDALMQSYCRNRNSCSKYHQAFKFPVKGDLWFVMSKDTQLDTVNRIKQAWRKRRAE